MEKYSAELDVIFVALADPTRRAVVRRLGRGEASVGELASAHPMTLPSFLKHIRMLERSGLVRTAKHGRTRRCRLDHDRLALVEHWLERERRSWVERTDRLESFVLEDLDLDREPAAPQHPSPDQQETP